MKHILIPITIIFTLICFCQCSDARRNNHQIAERTAIDLINNIDNTTISILKEYGYERRGDYEFWEKLSSDTTSYSCSYKVNGDTNKLSIFRPMNFVEDFPSTFTFDTSLYYEFTFFERSNKILRILRVDSHGQDHFSDTLVTTDHLFPNHNPFTKFADLNARKDKLNFIGSTYHEGLGELIVFWIAPDYKLMYLPDSAKMNHQYKKYWLEEFESGKKLKEHWSLVRIR